jgi:threonyl-tRNA synthetase
LAASGTRPPPSCLVKPSLSSPAHRPFWLSPRQVLVIPVNTATHGAYAEEVAKTLWDAGIYAEADLSSAMLNKRIRTAELSQANFILGAWRALSLSNTLI